MQWWCSALGTQWTWTWRPYPGVWLFVGGLVVAGLALRRKADRPPGREHAHALWLVIGIVLVWAALDWPIGALGGYLASAHMAQFLLLTLTAPPLLLLGIYPAVGSPSASVPGKQDGGTVGNPKSAGRPALRVLTHPVVTIAIFTSIVILTHLPVVTDTLMPTQLGSLAIDLSWLGGGLLFWWPVVAPGRPAWFGTPLRIVYLFCNMVLMTAPGAMITFSDLPIYATFELAPPIPGITALNDQRLAGLNMRVGAAIATWLAISILFIRWNRDEERKMREETAAARSAG